MVEAATGTTAREDAMDAADLSWVVAAIAWSVGGLVVGFILGYMAREIREQRDELHDLREALMDEQAAHHATKHGTGHQEGTEAPGSGDRRSGDDRRHPGGSGRLTAILGIVVVLLSVASVTVMALSVARQSDVNDCQRRYNIRSDRASVARARAAADDREAITTLIRVTATVQAAGPGVPQSERRATFTRALSDYLDTIDRSDKIRQANPITGPPKCALK